MLRSWHFIGDRETLSIRWSANRIVTVPQLEGAKFIEPEIPGELRASRR